MYRLDAGTATLQLLGEEADDFDDGGDGGTGAAGRDETTD